MPAVARFTIALIVAAIASFAVFWIMQTLISSGGSVLEADNTGKLVDFVDISRDDDVVTKDRKPEKPPAAPKEPPKPDMPKPSVDSKADTQGMDIGMADVTSDLQVDAGLSGGSGDGDYLPIVKVAPQYPRTAAQRGIEGYVVLEFTVTELGTVSEPKVIEADPPAIFDQAAIQAALKFKYKPKMVNGKAEAVSGVRNIIRFELDKSKR